MAKRLGFAAMDPDKQRLIASKGGREAHQKGHAHRWTKDEARLAGLKGGAARHRPRSDSAAFPHPPTSALTAPEVITEGSNK